MEEAILDFVARDPVTDQQIFVDVTVVNAFSANAARLSARARKDGVAASQAVNGKHSRYSAENGSLVALAFESGGRPAEETVKFLQSWQTSSLDDELGGSLAPVWQHCSTLIQLGNAEHMLSAIGVSTASRARPRAGQDTSRPALRPLPAAPLAFPTPGPSSMLNRFHSGGNLVLRE